MGIKKVLTTAIVASAVAMAGGLKDVDADTLVKMQSKGVPVIDIRTPGEWQNRGVIKGAKKMMFFDGNGKPHAQEWIGQLSKLIKNKKSPFIIYCAHANRTKALGNWLTQKMGYENVYELKGGIEYGWIDKGRATVK